VYYKHHSKMENNMTLSFSPFDSYTKMVMDLTEQKLNDFFEIVEEKSDVTEDYDEGFLYDCEA